MTLTTNNTVTLVTADSTEGLTQWLFNIFIALNGSHSTQSIVIHPPLSVWPHFLGHETKCLRTFQLVHPVRLNERSIFRQSSVQTQIRHVKIINGIKEDLKKMFDYQLVFLSLYTRDASFDPNQHQQSGHLGIRQIEGMETNIKHTE